jgi:hypothetical protein
MERGLGSHQPKVGSSQTGEELPWHNVSNISSTLKGLHRNSGGAGRAATSQSSQREDCYQCFNPVRVDSIHQFFTQRSRFAPTLG